MVDMRDTATEMAEEVKAAAMQLETATVLENNMQTGKAGEYLVCADLIIKGFVAYPSEQGLPYDVVLDYNGRLAKVQVKTVSKPSITPQREKVSYEYVFNMSKRGKNRQLRYSDEDVDLFAMVTLDTKKIGYLIPSDFRFCKTFRVDLFRGTYHDEKGIRDYEKIIKLHNQGLRNCEVAKILNISDTQVGRMLKSTYKPYKTKGQYFSEIERDKKWILDALGWEE